MVDFLKNTNSSKQQVDQVQSIEGVDGLLSFIDRAPQKKLNLGEMSKTANLIKGTTDCFISPIKPLVVKTARRISKQLGYVS